MTKAPQTVGILLFDDVEILDFAGPLQVFCAAQYINKNSFKSVNTVGLSSRVRVSKTNLYLNPEHQIEEGHTYDLLLLPGGFGTRQIIKDKSLQNKVSKLIETSQICASVCTGSLILAQLGLLTGKKATTHLGAIDLMKKIDPEIEIDRTKRYHDHERFVVSEGVSAGIDMSLYLLSKYYGKDLSSQVRKYIEYYPDTYTR